jgi:hypothetical protein
MREPLFLYILAGVLAIGAIWPIQIVVAWIGGDIAIARQLLRGDSLGFGIFPSLLMFARPGLALIGALSGPLASYVAFRGTAVEAFATLAKAALAQGTVALVLYISERSTNGVLGWILLAFENPRQAGSIRSADAVALQAASAASLLTPLVVVAVCYGIGAVLAEFIRPRAAESEPVPESQGLEELPAVVDVAASNAPPQPATGAATAFRQSTYEVRPSLGRMVAFTKWNNDYEIRAAAFARSNQERYSFSMTTGMLRREPGGVPLLTLRYANDKAFEVVDNDAGMVAMVQLQEPGCEIQDRVGRPIISVVRVDSGPGRALYRARCAGLDVCDYTWSSGSGPLNPLLLVDFESGKTFDRGLALVVAPFLEEEARLESEKYFRYQG